MRTLIITLFPFLCFSSSFNYTSEPSQLARCFAAQGYFDKLSFLIKDVDESTVDHTPFTGYKPGMTILDIAVSFKSPECTMLLLKKGANPAKHISGYNKEHDAILAMNCSDEYLPEVFKALLKKNKGYSNPETVKLLLSRGRCPQSHLYLLAKEEYAENYQQHQKAVKEFLVETTPLSPDTQSIVWDFVYSKTKKVSDEPPPKKKKVS